MADDQDDLFKPRMGKPRADTARSSGPSAHRVLSFQQQVMRAMAKAGTNPRGLKRAGGKPKPGRFNARGRGAKVMRTLTRDSGWQTDSASGQRLRMRRVIVKARYVKLKGSQSRAAYAHLRYLQRDGVSRDNEPGELYGRGLDTPDGPDFLSRSNEDRHQFRLIVAPEDGVELGDLRGFTRNLMDQVERDLETRLDWVAVDHHNTAHPHTHILIRGVTEDDRTLNIAGDYIAHGIRTRASAILTRELGLQTEREVEQQLDREVDQERFTSLDHSLVEQAGAERALDLRLDPSGDGVGDVARYRLIRRLKKLERLGLATEVAPGQWTLSPKTEKTLRELGERGDIIKTMHRALEKRGLVRGFDAYAIHRSAEQEAVVVGRVVGKGLGADEMADRVHVVVDGIDGRIHYAEMAGSQAEGVAIGSVVEIGRARARAREADKTIAEIARGSGGVYEPAIHLGIVREMERVPGGDAAGFVEAHVRRLEALRRGGIVERLDDHRWSIPRDYLDQAQAYDTRRNPQLGARLLSALDLDAQVTANGATWLDRELVTRTPLEIRDSGFGREANRALARRQQWLVEQDLAQADGDRVRYRANLLATLTRREVADKGSDLVRQHGGTFHAAEDGERITGRYTGAVELVSGKYALIETHSREFTLVPWRPVIEHELGRTVSGVMAGDGISWELGRQRGRGLSI
jgi:type IV secretory pathway VirD2 relaxase